MAKSKVEVAAEVYKAAVKANADAHKAAMDSTTAARTAHERWQQAQTTLATAEKALLAAAEA